MLRVQFLIEWTRAKDLSGSADDRFREMFYEEARELLISLEEGLMDLERRQSDRAHLDKTFRAAHSLKGAAAMVGLAAIAEFTHRIEAVLERIRAGSLAVDSDIITTLLEARDHLAAMVEAEAARSPISASGELTQRLTSLLRGPAALTRPASGRTTDASRSAPESLRDAGHRQQAAFRARRRRLRRRTPRQPRAEAQSSAKKPALGRPRSQEKATCTAQENAEDGPGAGPPPAAAAA